MFSFMRNTGWVDWDLGEGLQYSEAIMNPILCGIFLFFFVCVRLCGCVCVHACVAVTVDTVVHLERQKELLRHLIAVGLLLSNILSFPPLANRSCSRPPYIISSKAASLVERSSRRLTSQTQFSPDSCFFLPVGIILVTFRLIAHVVVLLLSVGVYAFCAWITEARRLEDFSLVVWRAPMIFVHMHYW
uniref:Uncharacterized protein TCIL3000_11_14670 n=1 Tax=Trypanosoma congolense (strain IL3000) TaxID=1068625 RepID=G0V2S8_TRYCI|nr:unnamed protein product [Trypanosoma congolense IL3000]